MLYLDYGRTEGNWIPNKYGGNGNLEAMSFLKHFNSMMRKRFPQAVTIAEESTAWPMVSGDPDNGECLGFTFKWNMGWMHDFLEYMKLDPYFRKFNHSKMTFSLMYAYSEHFVLVLSHDEVVHLKCSMLGKMPGDRESKFANLKLAYAYMCGWIFLYDGTSWQKAVIYGAGICPVERVERRTCIRLVSVR